MSREHLKKLAQELKSTREEKGFTLDQIYGRTRIDLKFLQAIEWLDILRNLAALELD